MAHGLPVGKLPAEILAGLLARLPAAVDADVLLGPATGEDAAAVRLGDQALVLAADPVTFAADEIGWYAVHINANDVATRGAAPRWFLATILLPEGCAPTLPLAITDQIVRACAEVGAVLVGGHTEITAGVPRPIVAGTMVGSVALAEVRRTGSAQPGDAIVLTQGIAIEGTALIARERPTETERLLGRAAAARCRALLRQPGLSVVSAARLAVGAGARALHDPTEGGLATALHELAEAADAGLVVDATAVRILPETVALCQAFGLDPLGLLASGALLITVEPSQQAAVLAALLAGGIPAAVIGEVRPRSAGRLLRNRAGERPLPHFARDELARLFA